MEAIMPTQTDAKYEGSHVSHQSPMEDEQLQVNKAVLSSSSSSSLESKHISRKCGHCGKTFSRLSNLSRHVKVSHAGKRFLCLACDRNFTSKESLLHHVRITHERLRCDVCFQVFDSILAKDSHECPGKQKSVFSVCCSICNKTFSCHSNLNKHKQVAHFGRMFTCATCFKVLRSKESMVEHNRSSHGQFLCTKCSNAFFSEEAFVQHVAEKHHFLISLQMANTKRETTGERNLFKTMRKHYPVSCDRCGKLFSTKSNVTKHIRVIHDKEMRNGQPCPDEYLHDKQQHRLSTTIPNQLKTFKCALCPLKFYERRSLGKHEQTDHSRLVSDGGCQCEICGKTFLYECNLRRHVKRHHEGNGFFCPAMKFTGKEMAEEHQFMQHEEGQRFICTHCCNSFQSEYKLREHILVSHRSRVHASSACKKQFPYHLKLPYHLQKHQCQQNDIGIVDGDREQSEPSMPSIDFSTSNALNHTVITW